MVAVAGVVEREDVRRRVGRWLWESFGEQVGLFVAGWSLSPDRVIVFCGSVDIDVVLQRECRSVLVCRPSRNRAATRGGQREWSSEGTAPGPPRACTRPSEGDRARPTNQPNNGVVTVHRDERAGPRAQTDGRLGWRLVLLRSTLLALRVPSILKGTQIKERSTAHD